MATLKHEKTGQIRPVPARMLVGRSPACALKLTGSHVSGEHSTLIWSGRAWEVRDLGSRNGTFVDGKRIGAGEGVGVESGARLAFGALEDVWLLMEAGPPCAIAEDAKTGAQRLPADGILALPDEDHPEALVYADGSGRWVVENPDRGVRPVVDGEIIAVAGSTWKIHVPETQVGTATVNVLAQLEAVKLKFAVSRDEEHVQVTVEHRGRGTLLEAREHWYTLLTLARLRMKDEGEPAAEQGWIERDDLLKMLGLDSNALNVAIYRARRQLQAAGVDGAAGLVEVRRGQRRIGVSCDRLELVSM